MKFAFATALMASSAAAFSPSSFSASSTALQMSAVEKTELYTFEKSEEIFAEAKNVSLRKIAQFICILLSNFAKEQVLSSGRFFSKH